MLYRDNAPHFATLCCRLNRMVAAPGVDPAVPGGVDGSREIRQGRCSCPRSAI